MLPAVGPFHPINYFDKHRYSTVQGAADVLALMKTSTNEKPDRTKSSICFTRSAPTVARWQRATLAEPNS